MDRVVMSFRRAAARRRAGRTIRALDRARRRPLRLRMPRLSPFPVMLTLCLLYVGYLNLPQDAPETGARAAGGEIVDARFTRCGAGPRINCVIDGDTFYYRGQKIRLSGIDTPETHEPRCREEAELGAAATRRFQELLNAGPFVIVRTGRDEDQYARKLRDVRRDGRSLGAVLVNEGLARPWTGRRMPWCV